MGVRALLLVLLGISSGLAGCGSAPAECEDVDGDGFGPGCELGDDCDPRNAARTDDCDIVPPPDCVADPLATGCPCIGGVAECYGADPATLAHGACQVGSAICVGGTWGLCNGAVRPRFETCDEVDQDCDGRTDEGVRSPCGGCTPGCVGGVWGEGEAPFEAGGDLALTELGSLTLRREERRLDELWITNTAEATLSRIDANRAVEVARYPTGGSEPTRVAVDWLGDAVVANRDFDGVSRVRKITSDPERCVDLDADGLETSTGPDDVRFDDECVAWTVPVGETGEVARALAIDGLLGPDGGGGGDVWVGLHDGERIVHLDGTSGAVREVIETPGFAPYAAAFDADGVLWVASRDGQLLSVDRFTEPREVVRREVPLPCFLLYGLDVDAEGRVFLTGFSCDQVMIFDPREERWSVRVTPPSPRGAVVVDDDGAEPRAFFAHTDGRVSSVRLRPLVDVETFDLQDATELPSESIGVASTSAGIWVASSRSALEGRGVATRVDPDTGEVTAHVPLGAAPHPQGDLSGSKLAGGFVPEGSAQRVFGGCGEGETTWVELHVEADVPPSTDDAPAGEVEVALRWAADEAGLAAASFEVVGVLPSARSPFPLSLPEGGVVEVRLVLRTAARDGAPRVHRVGLRHSCPGPD